jgi:photosystem II stability/assembly factor-like uncharacterized protein
MKHSNTVSRQNSRYFKPLVKSLSVAVGLALGVSAWAGVDRWTVAGSWGSPDLIGYSGNVVYAAMNPDNPKQWYLSAQVGSDSGYDGQAHMVYHSSNEGKSWEILTEQAIWLDGYDDNMPVLSIAPSNPQIMYALSQNVYGHDTAKLLKSQNGGKHWSEQDKTMDLAMIAIHPQNSELLYAYSNVSKSLVKSTDSGVTWTNIGEAWDVSSWATRWGSNILIDKENPAIIYAAASTTDIRRSQDNGATWQTLPGTETDIPLEIKIRDTKSNVDGSFVYKKGSYRGVSLSTSTNQGSTWLSRTLPETDWLISGTRVFEIWPDPTQANTLYFIQGKNYPNHEWGFAKSTDAGKTWQTPIKIKIPTIKSPSYIDTDGVSSSLAPQIRYKVDALQLSKTLDNGATWRTVGQLPVEPADRLGVKVSHIFPDRLYLAGASTLYRSNDAGQIWTQVHTLKNGVYRLVESPESDTLYVYDAIQTILSGFIENTVYKTTDGGQTWTDIGLDTVLPGTTVKYKEVNRMSGSGATHYAATDKGIYVSQDSGATWAQFNSAGLPFAQMKVDEVRLDPNDSTVLYADTAAGTFVYGKNSPPNINSAELVSQSGNTAKLAVYGNYLDTANLTITLPDCANMTKASGGDDMTQYFECQITGAGAKTGEVKDAGGTVLSSFSATLALPQPTVSGVSPLSAKQGETATFTVSGQNFPSSLNISVADCAPVQTVAPETCTTTQCQHTCTPSGAGTKAGTVKDSAGNVLFNFNVNVQATVSQCAVYNPAQTPHVSVPCVQVGTDVFSAGMNIIPAPGLRFEVDLNSLQAITERPGEECAVFPHNGGLRLNCVDVGGTKFWAELGLVPGVPGIEFDLSSADVK